MLDLTAEESLDMATVTMEEIKLVSHMHQIPGMPSSADSHQHSHHLSTCSTFPSAQFKTTLVARRFPGLRGLMDEDVRNLILADRKKSGIKLLSPQKTHPKRDFAAAPPARDVPGSGSIPFVPINQAQAKENVRRPDIEVRSERGDGCKKVYACSKRRWALFFYVQTGGVQDTHKAVE